MKRSRIAAVIIALYIPSTLFGIDQQAAVQKAVTFLRRLEPGISSQELSQLQIRRRKTRMRLGTQLYRWSVSTQRRSVSIDDETGEITMYSDGLLGNRAMGGPESVRHPQIGRPFYSSEANLIAQARSKLDVLGWNIGQDTSLGSLPSRDPEGNVRRTIVNLKFSDRPYGFPAPGIGNFSHIGLDSLTGEVVALQRGVGWTYGPPILNLTEAQATVVAARVIELGESARVFGPKYAIVSEWDVIPSARGRNLCQSKTIPLAYVVFGRTEGLVIAADNGEVLSRFDARTTGGRSPVSTPSPQSVASVAPRKNSDGSFSSIHAVASLAGLLVVGWAWLMLRRVHAVRVRRDA